MKKLRTFEQETKRLNLSKIKGGDSVPELSLAQKTFSNDKGKNSGVNDALPELSLAQK